MKELAKNWLRTVEFHERTGKEPSSFTKELTKNRQISSNTGKNHWFSGRLFDLFKISGNCGLCIRTGYLIFLLRIMVRNLKNQPDTWLGVWCNSNTHPTTAIAHQLNPSSLVGGQLLNFEVTVGLGRLLLQKKKRTGQRTAQPAKFQTSLGTTKT